MVHPVVNSPCGSDTTSGQSAQSRNTVPERGCALDARASLAAASLAAANLAPASRAAASLAAASLAAVSRAAASFAGNVLATLPYVKSGRLHALAVSTAERSAVLPDLPTIAESGVPGFDVSTWHGWLAPAGTPPAIVNKLSAELAIAVKSADVAKRLAEDGGEPLGGGPEQLRNLIAVEVPRWRKVVRDADMRVE